MLNIPENIKQLYRQDNNSQQTRKKLKLMFFDNVKKLAESNVVNPSQTLFPSENANLILSVENNKIDSESLKITESLSSQADLKFGACEGSTFEITIADTAIDLTDKEFLVSLEVGGCEIAMGVYRVTSYERQANRRKKKIVANDRMSLFNRDVSNWYNTLKFPMTLLNLRNSLCNHLGINQVQTSLIFDNMEITKTLDPSQLSGLEVIQAICEINGCFGHFDNVGLFKYITLPQTGLYPSEDLFPYNELYPSEKGGDNRTWETLTQYKHPCTYEDYLVDSIDGVAIRDEIGSIDVSYGACSNTYQVLSNFLVYGKTKAERTDIAKRMLDVIGSTSYRPVNVQTSCLPWVELGDGVHFHTRDDFIETIVMQRTITGIQAMFDTYVSTGNKKRSTKIDIKSEIKQLGGKTAKITKELDKVSVELTDFQKNTAAQLKVMNEEISAKVSKENLISEINISPEQIVLKSNRLIVESTNFKLDAQGNATFSGIINGGSININNKFKVDSNGNLTAEGGTFNGDITGATFNGTGTLKGINLACTWVNTNLVTIGPSDAIYLDGKTGNGTFQGDIYSGSLFSYWGKGYITPVIQEMWGHVSDALERIHYLEQNVAWKSDLPPMV